MDPIRFNQRMMKISKNVEINANEAVKKVARAFSDTVIRDTPADSGKAISNWQVGVGHAPSSILQPYVPGRHGDTAQSNRYAASANNAAKIATRRTGTTIYVVNNVPYIDRLNSGWSQQAPAGFVDSALAEADMAIKGVKILRD